MTKLWKIAHTFTFLSLFLTFVGAILISPYILVTLLSTFFIFKSAERIRAREEEAKDK